MEGIRMPMSTGRELAFIKALQCCCSSDSAEDPLKNCFYGRMGVMDEYSLDPNNIWSSTNVVIQQIPTLLTSSYTYDPTFTFVYPQSKETKYLRISLSEEYFLLFDIAETFNSSGSKEYTNLSAYSYNTHQIVPNLTFDVTTLFWGDEITTKDNVVYDKFDIFAKVNTLPDTYTLDLDNVLAEILNVLLTTERSTVYNYGGTQIIYQPNNNVLH